MHVSSNVNELLLSCLFHFVCIEWHITIKNKINQVLGGLYFGRKLRLLCSLLHATMKHLHCLRDMAEGGNMLIQDSLSAAVGGASESKRLDN